MAYNKIESIYKKLHWKNSKEIQEEGIKEALKIKDLSYFMQPLESKYNKSYGTIVLTLLFNGKMLS